MRNQSSQNLEAATVPENRNSPAHPVTLSHCHPLTPSPAPPAHPVTLSPRQESLGRIDAPVIGLIGGIGSGKSRVAAELARHGGVVLSGDEFGHEALRQADIRDKIVRRWGDRILDEN